MGAGPFQLLDLRLSLQNEGVSPDHSNADLSTALSGVENEFDFHFLRHLAAL